MSRVLKSTPTFRIHPGRWIHVRGVCSYKVVPLEGHGALKSCCWSKAMNGFLNGMIKIRQYSLLARREQQKDGTERQSGKAVLRRSKPAGRTATPQVNETLMSAVTHTVAGEVPFSLVAANNCSNRIPIWWFSDTNWQMTMTLLAESSVQKKTKKQNLFDLQFYPQCINLIHKIIDFSK